MVQSCINARRNPPSKKQNIMALVQVSSLLGKNIRGMKFDCRTRTASGELVYPEQQREYIPAMFTCVEVLNQRGQDRLFWRYHGHGIGYSSVQMDGKTEHEIFLEIE